MHKFILTTDTSCDVFRKELDAAGIPWVPLTYAVGSASQPDNFSDDAQYTAFYAEIRKGIMPTTSQINIFSHEEFFNSVLDKGGNTIIHIPLSEGLSNTANSAVLAAENVMEARPGTKIYIIKSLSATQGNHYILDEALTLRDSGADAEEAVEFLNNFASKLHHWIIVDDLFHLKRGGRVSGASAYIGSMLKIKPVLIINNEGKLAVVKKVKGTSKAYAHVLEMIAEHCENKDAPKIYLASADAADKAADMASLLKEAYPACTIKTGWIGPIIGAHTGADTLGVVFLGKGRLDNK